MAIDTGLSDVNVVLFDFDGTLYDLETDLDGWRRSARLFLAPSDRWRWKVDDILASTAGAGRAAILAELAAAEAVGLRRGHPIPGAAQAVAAVNRHARVGIVSRNLRPTIDEGLASMGLGHLVSVARQDTVHTKPGPAPFVLALNRLGAGARHALVVGDSSHDVEGAKASGLRVVITDNHRLQHRPEGADAYVGSLAELPSLLGLTGGGRRYSHSPA